MKNTLIRLSAGSLILASLAGCTHAPSGKPLFDNYEQCMKANAAGSVAGGLLAGVATAALTGKTGAGVAVGATVTGASLYLSWVRCAAAYQKVENTEIKPQGKSKKALAEKLAIDKLELQTGLPGEEIKRTMRYVINSADADKQDILVKETSILMVPRTGSLPDGSIAFTDLQGKPVMVDGKPVRPGQSKIPVDKLFYQEYAVPGIDVTVRPGTRKSDGLLPTDTRMQPGIPYRLKMQVSALGMQDESIQTFYFRQK